MSISSIERGLSRFDYHPGFDIWPLGYTGPKSYSFEFALYLRRILLPYEVWAPGLNPVQLMDTLIEKRWPNQKINILDLMSWGSFIRSYAKKDRGYGIAVGLSDHRFPWMREYDASHAIKFIKCDVNDIALFNKLEFNCPFNLIVCRPNACVDALPQKEKLIYLIDSLRLMLTPDGVMLMQCPTNSAYEIDEYVRKITRTANVFDAAAFFSDNDRFYALMIVNGQNPNPRYQSIQ